MDNKPSIVDVISDYLPLRRTGKEWQVCCPFHEDKHPSFFVNEDLGVFYCFGCHATGDVFDFLMKWSDKSFKEVAEHLGVGAYHHRRMKPDSSEIAAENIYLWVVEFSRKVAERLAEIGHELQLAKDIKKKEEAEILERQWTILEILHEDLFTPEYILELWFEREKLENLLQ